MNSLLFLSLFLACVGYGQQSTHCEKYFSPDKKYTAQLVATDKETTLLIQNRLTGSNDFLKTLTSSVDHVQWTPNSQSLLLVEHLSGGSMATIIHGQNGCWTLYDGDPPISEKGYYFVIGVHFSGEVAQLKYGVYPSKGSSLKKQKLCIFDINLKTGASTLVSLNLPSTKDLNKLTKKEKRKWEMWEKGTANNEINSDYF